jgi:DNA-binding HxlR family transcriptional regulator
MMMPKFEPIILHEDCAHRRVLELFSVKWTTMVLHALHFHGGTCRTGVLSRSLPGISKKMLTQTLREMERDGLIVRKVYPVVPPMVEYSLTPMGQLFIEPIEMLYAWAAKNDDALSKLRRRRKKHTASRDKSRKGSS